MNNHYEGCQKKKGTKVSAITTLYLTPDYSRQNCNELKAGPARSNTPVGR